MGEFNFNFRGIRGTILIFINFLSNSFKQRWDAAFCGGSSGATLFAFVKRKMTGLYGLGTV